MTKLLINSIYLLWKIAAGALDSSFNIHMN